MKSMIEEIYHTMKHARIFIDSKEKMNKTGVGLYDEFLSKIEDIVTKPRQCECGEARTRQADAQDMDR